MKNVTGLFHKEIIGTEIEHSYNIWVRENH
jgi:hypothetical protein